MNLGFRFRTAVAALSEPLAAEFDSLYATLQAWTAKEHHSDGTHSDLTADSLEVAGSNQPPVQWVWTTSDLLTNSATLADVSGLSVTLAAFETYAFEAFLHVPSALQVSVALGGTATNSSTAGDPDVSYLIEMIDTSADVLDYSNGSHGTYGLGVRHDSNAGTGYLTIRWTGWLKTATAGTFTIQFAKVTGGGSNATLRRGSWLKVWSLT